MPDRRTLLLTVLAMLAFAGNSLLCRAAEGHRHRRGVSFRRPASLLRPSCSPSCRICAGARPRPRAAALALGGAVHLRGRVLLRLRAAGRRHRHTRCCYSAPVQITCCWPACGGQLGGQALLGFLLALGGLLFLLLPGQRAALGGALLMLISGLAWGLYTLLGRGGGGPLAVGAGGFLRALAATPPCRSWAFLGGCGWTAPGWPMPCFPAPSASGLGYAVWYSTAGAEGGVQGASVQLSVPVLAALCGAHQRSASRSPRDCRAGDPGGARRDR